MLVIMTSCAGIGSEMLSRSCLGLGSNSPFMLTREKSSEWGAMTFPATDPSQELTQLAA